MRLVQITIPTGKRDTVRRLLEDEGLEYTMTDETSRREFEAVAYVPLPQPAVEPVMDKLRALGMSDDAITVVVEASTVVSERFEELAERYAEENDEDRIGREELRSSAADLMPTTRNYLILTIVSAVVATAGLLLNSAAVVVGSMVIAPLVGPALSASVGTVIDDHGLRVRGVTLQALGIGCAIASAAIFAGFVQMANLVPPGIEILDIDQIRERLAPDFLALAIALGAGVAGAVSLSTGVSAAIVGVMIAVALIPPAAVVGIALAWGDTTLALGSGVFVLVNVLSINMAALAVLWYQGYRPETWFRTSTARVETLTRIGVLAVVILVLSVFLAGVTFASYEGALAEEEIRGEAAAVIDEHQGLVLMDVTVEQSDHPLRGTPETVVLTVGKAESVDSPPIAHELQERLESEPRVEVHFVEVQVRE
ncbi:TIGR00341 family protein [Natronosalvus vescus]|uniref:TIGR00341 family protein n=1 Tax=Natronosalvus vescus TaxID=2953881 RepID=UPI002091766B|nr:TIGR00341 family protein [Natronosalvus vescus]